MYDDSPAARSLGAFLDDSLSEAEYLDNALPEELELRYPEGIPVEVLEAYYESRDKGDEDE